MLLYLRADKQNITNCQEIWRECVADGRNFNFRFLSKRKSCKFPLQASKPITLTWKQSLLTVKIIRYTQSVRRNTKILHVTANGTYKHQYTSNDHDIDRERKLNSNTELPLSSSPTIFTVTHALSLTCNSFLFAVGTVSS